MTCLFELRIEVEIDSLGLVKALVCGDIVALAIRG